MAPHAASAAALIVTCTSVVSALTLTNSSGLAARATENRGHMFINVQIDKAGSSTMRVLNDERSRIHNWQPPCKCNDPKQWVNNGKKGHCSDVPDSSIVQGGWGACVAFSGFRPCSYIVILRDPMSRLLSAYSYFCLGCKDKNKYCGKFFEPHSCPNLSFVDFAVKYGNLYTRKFSRSNVTLNELLDGGDYFTEHGIQDTGFLHGVTQADADAAIANLRSQSVNLIALEDPDRMKKLVSITGDTAGFPTENQEDIHQNSYHEESFTPAEKELERVRQVMAPDIRLYGELLGHIRKVQSLARVEDILGDMYDARESPMLMRRIVGW